MTSSKEFPSAHKHNALIFSFVAVAIGFVLLRLHRRYRDKALRIDDALCAIALLFTVWEAVELHMQFTIQREMYYWLMNVPPGEFPFGNPSLWPPERQEQERWIWRHGFLMVMSQGIGLGVVKCSILAFYLRFIILKLPQRINYALISFTALITLWWFLMQFLETSPPIAIWMSDSFDYVFVVEPSLQEIIFSVVHIAIDIALLLFPLPAIISLHLPRTEKAGLVLVYSTGFVSFAMTILGLYGNIKVRIGFNKDDWQDEKIAHAWSGIWSNMELCTAVICACMPSLSRMFHSCVRAMSPSFPESNVWPIHKNSSLNNPRFGATTRSERAPPLPPHRNSALPKRKSRFPLLPSTPKTDIESIRPSSHHPFELSDVSSNSNRHSAYWGE